MRRIEMEADAPRQVYVVCIHPERSTSIYFDAKVSRVELAQRERFRLQQGDEGLTLLPEGAFLPGERVLLTVYFGDGAAPESVTFELVVHPSEVERQVVVTRKARTLASYRQGEQQARAEIRQCREEKALLQAGFGGVGGLTGLIVLGLVGGKGAALLDITESVTRPPGSVIRAWQIRSYRVVGPDGERGRVAVEMMLWNESTKPWTPRGAVLVGPRGEALAAPTVWPREPIAPGKPHQVIVEVDAAEWEARGAFSLELRGGEGEPILRLDGVTFP